MTIFFLIILLFLLWPVLKAAYAINKARRQARDFFNAATGGRQGGFYGGAPYRDSERPAGWSRNTSSMRPKVFTRDMGEYIDFEEIEESTATSTGSSTYTRSSCSTESFISDAEWEDIEK